ncbi:MAG: cytochrome c maturation protein CcmE [Chloroflexi bacterium]|nr:cytochrome c maturation protein CcmE [Chloroflexota bacterium]MCL5076040.1 cytochrome c maturation protein CcmE [Chloroflexota bacterium]
MNKNRKFLIGGLIIALAIAYLIFTAMRGGTAYYITVSELKSKGHSIYGEPVRLLGRVVDGTIERDAKNLMVKFRVAEGGEQVPVVYKGVPPDAFTDGADVVLEGKYTASGTFEANTILAKCPSKYEPAAGPSSR